MSNNIVEKVRVTKEFVFDMGHALFGYDGPCKDIHGHTYHLSVTVLGVPVFDPRGAKDGMVVDFNVIKAIVNDRIIAQFDHALVLNQIIPEENKTAIEQVTSKIVYLNVQPSCENLLLHFKNLIIQEFQEIGLELHSMKLYETPTSYAEWCKSDN
jgi:6-pyruvoyltetrahydropterin/6-carboxytetrahydropterin synthase